MCMQLLCNSFHILTRGKFATEILPTSNTLLSSLLWVLNVNLFAEINRIEVSPETLVYVRVLKIKDQCLYSYTDGLLYILHNVLCLCIISCRVHPCSSKK